MLGFHLDSARQEMVLTGEPPSRYSSQVKTELEGGQAFDCSSTNAARVCTGNRPQLFFLSILRFRTMSLRLSKLETVRVDDLAPSFSACNS